MTKAEEVYTKTEAMIAEGVSKADAFKKLAAHYGQKVNSVRGLYYAHTSGKGGSTARSRRRETTPENALADARASLERSIESIDREVKTAAERVTEAQGEYESLKGSAEERKAAIAKNLEALK
jgi:chromosome segregation ATPase